MPFDALLMLADNTKDWTKAYLDLYGTAAANISTTKNAGGFDVIDLGSAKIGGSVRGLAVVLVIDEVGEAAGDQLTVTVQESATEIFTTPHELAEFDILAATRGVILGSECPCTVIRRISPTLQFLRVLASTGAGADFHTCWVLLSPYPYRVL